MCLATGFEKKSKRTRKGAFFGKIDLGVHRHELAMRILNIILYNLLSFSFILVRGDKEIDIEYDYICIFPPYTSIKYIERELASYVDSGGYLHFFKPSTDDGLITRAAIYNRKLIYIKNEIKEGALSYDAGCRRND